MMGSEIEAYCCMLLNTKYMRDLLFEPKNLEKHRDIIEILGHDEKFKSIEQIKKINNIHIQNAIKELEKQKEFALFDKNRQ